MWLIAHPHLLLSPIIDMDIMVILSMVMSRVLAMPLSASTLKISCLFVPSTGNEFIWKPVKL